MTVFCTVTYDLVVGMLMYVYEMHRGTGARAVLWTLLPLAAECVCVVYGIG